MQDAIIQLTNLVKGSICALKLQNFFRVLEGEKTCYSCMGYRVEFMRRDGWRLSLTKTKHAQSSHTDDHCLVTMYHFKCILLTGEVTVGVHFAKEQRQRMAKVLINRSAAKSPVESSYSSHKCLFNCHQQVPFYEAK